MNLPISISADNYLKYKAQLAAYAPINIYAWLTDPYLAQRESNYQAQIDNLIGNNECGKALLFSSLATFEDHLADAFLWTALNVTKLLYNTEAELTPAEEMATLNSADPAVNAVALFAALAKANGFASSWGPIRGMADAVSDGTIKAMIGAGLGGIGLQEQKFIECACAVSRISAVRSTVARYKKLATTRPFSISVQVMAGRCLNGDAFGKANCKFESIKKDYDHCLRFVNGISGFVDEIGIFAMGTEAEKLPAFVKALRI